MDEDQWYALAKSQQSAEWRQGYATILTDLRAKVEALPSVIVDSTPWSVEDPHNVDLCVRRADVLALFDGSGDE